jgi:hypothetical protein
MSNRVVLVGGGVSYCLRSVSPPAGLSALTIPLKLAGRGWLHKRGKIPIRLDADFRQISHLQNPICLFDEKSAPVDILAWSEMLAAATEYLLSANPALSARNDRRPKPNFIC